MDATATLDTLEIPVVYQSAHPSVALMASALLPKLAIALEVKWEQIAPSIVVA